MLCATACGAAKKSESVRHNIHKNLLFFNMLILSTILAQSKDTGAVDVQEYGNFRHTARSH
jgi:hypothetical protein